MADLELIVDEDGNVAAIYSDALLPYFDAQIGSGEYPNIEELFGGGDVRETWQLVVETMTSESQERMLLVVKPEGIDRVTDVVKRWSLHASVIGRITDD